MGVPAITETSQYLTFKLNHEVFAFDISQVREVLDFTSVTKVPQTPDYMLGVINLRGSAVPVVDMCLKFGMTRTEKALPTCIIIVAVELDGRATTLGALAESVQGVTELDPDQIERPPQIGMRLKNKFIKGIGKQGGAFIIILDSSKVFSGDELALVQEMHEEAV